MSVNKVTILGRVGKDPEVKEFNGNKVARFSVATSEKWKDKSGAWQEKTEWHNVSFWGKIVDSYIQPYLKRGSQVFVEGKLQTRTWDDKDGNKRSAVEIQGLNIEIMNSRSTSSSTTSSSESDSGYDSNFSSDEIPF